MEQWAENLLIFVIPAIIASIPAIISAIYSRRSTDKQLELSRIKIDNEKGEIEATITEKVATSYNKLVGDLQEAQNKLKEELRDTKQRVSELEREALERDKQISLLLDKVDRGNKKIARLQYGIKRLISQLEERGIEPSYR